MSYICCWLAGHQLGDAFRFTLSICSTGVTRLELVSQAARPLSDIHSLCCWLATIDAQWINAPDTAVLSSRQLNWINNYIQ